MSFFRQNNQTISGINKILANQASQTQELTKIMSALTDLQAAVAALGTSTSNEIAAVTAAISASQGANNGAVAATDAEAIVLQLETLKANLDAETTALTPATPSPTSSTSSAG